MDGLELIEVSLKDLLNENPMFRIDSKFVNKKTIEVLNAVKRREFFYLKPSCIVNGPFGSALTSEAHLTGGGIPLIRSLNINDGFYVDQSNMVYISKKDSDMLQHSRLDVDDIVLSRVGSIGFFARIDSRLGICNISSNNIGIKLNSYSINEKHYILTYLNTKYAYLLTNRRATGNVQQKLTVNDIEKIPIPILSEQFYSRISSLIQLSEDTRNKSESIYSSAEQAFAQLVEMPAYKIESAQSYTKPFSESYRLSGRLDAEYYQPKYDVYLSLLQRFETTKIPCEFDVFKNTGTNYADGIDDVGVIKTKQLTNSGIDTDGVESYFSNELCIKYKSTFLVQNDVIFASMGVGSLGKVSLFSYTGDKAFVTDSTLRIYRAKKGTRILPEVLCVFLQSTVGQELIYRYVVGSTGIINIYDEDIAKIPIPIIDSAIQKDIAAKVQESFALRRRSKQLLEYAKQAVEMAIEQGEDAALAWLEEKS